MCQMCVGFSLFFLVGRQKTKSFSCHCHFIIFILKPLFSVIFVVAVFFFALLVTVCKQAYTANLQLYCQGTTLSGSYACLLLCGVFLSSFDTYPFSRFNVIRFTVQYTVKATIPVRETKNNSLIPKLGSQNTNPKISPEIRQSIPVN